MYQVFIFVLVAIFCNQHAILVSAANCTAGVKINELNADEPFVDKTDYLELIYPGQSSVPLDGYVVIFFNGANAQSYMNFELDGYTTNSNGLFVIGMSGLIPPPDVVIPGTSGIQNGPDGVGLYCNPASKSALTNESLVDALVYTSSKTSGSALSHLIEVLVPGQKLDKESGDSSHADTSLCRCVCDSTRTQSCFDQCSPTPGQTNACRDASSMGPTTATHSMFPTTATVPLVTTTEPIECPDGWKPYHGPTAFNGPRCFKASPSAIPLFEAESQCKEMNATLVSVHSEAQMQFINELTTESVGSEFWLGALKSSVSGDVSWLDNTPFTYSNWQPDQPDGTGNCAVTSTDPTCPGCWALRPCFAQHPFLCEYKDVPVRDFCGESTSIFRDGAVNFAQMCGPHGSCANTVNGAYCECSYGWSGQFCNQANDDLIETIQRCTLYETPKTKRLEVPSDCPKDTSCVPQQQQCIFKHCDFPIGHCISLDNVYSFYNGPNGVNLLLTKLFLHN